MKKTRVLFRPGRILKPGVIVTAEITPEHTVQSFVTGFSGQHILLEDWPEPVPRWIIR